MNISDFAAVPAIVIICTLVAQIFKTIAVKAGIELSELTPIVCALSGAILGGVCFVYYPAVIPAQDMITAIVIGIVSGWGATGAYETVKQLSSPKVKNLFKKV